MPTRKRPFSRSNDASDWDYEQPTPDYDNSGDGDGEFPAKTARGARLQRDMDEKQADGAPLKPVLPSATRDLSRTVWGQAWNRHLQTYADHVQPLTKGRTEFRKGRVLDLATTDGEITALVMGNRLWEVAIHAARLDSESWAELRRACVGQIADLSDLLSGEVPDGVMKRLAQPENGLFPSTSELRAVCSCPDHASLCIHAAAVLYAFGSALDEAPDQLFTLRGGKPHDLLAKIEEVMQDLTDGPAQEAARAEALAGQDLSTLFGLDIEAE